MKLIAAHTIADGWLQACLHLLGRPTWLDTTVVVHIQDPQLVRSQDRAVEKVLDRFLTSHHKHSNHTVAETLFPGDCYVRHGAEGVFHEYPDIIYPRIMKHGDMRPWGTYAYRLLRRHDQNGKEYNPLEYCIQKMRDAQPKRAAYEIGLGFGFDVATYDDDADRGSRMGGPCLSHVSFKYIDGAVHLSAMYRSHYYIERAFGNLLGLARLQGFVAAETHAEVGPLVCHSTMAVLDTGRKQRGGESQRPATGWLKSEVRPLIADCRVAMGLESAAEEAKDE